VLKVPHGTLARKVLDAPASCGGGTGWGPVPSSTRVFESGAPGARTRSGRCAEGKAFASEESPRPSVRPAEKEERPRHGGRVWCAGWRQGRRVW